MRVVIDTAQVIVSPSTIKKKKKWPIFTFTWKTQISRKLEATTRALFMRTDTYCFKGRVFGSTCISLSKRNIFQPHDGAGDFFFFFSATIIRNLLRLVFLFSSSIPVSLRVFYCKYPRYMSIRSSFDEFPCPKDSHLSFAVIRRRTEDRAGERKRVLQPLLSTGVVQTLKRSIPQIYTDIQIYRTWDILC